MPQPDPRDRHPDAYIAPQSCRPVARRAMGSAPCSARAFATVVQRAYEQPLVVQAGERRGDRSMSNRALLAQCREDIPAGLGAVRPEAFHDGELERADETRSHVEHAAVSVVLSQFLPRRIADEVNQGGARTPPEVSTGGCCYRLSHALCYTGANE